jgi:caffeoyl-CoA O-methyltransferase
LIHADNVLRHGRVVDQAVDDAGVSAMREFNATLVRDPRVETVLLPVFDGLTFARRRA